MDPAHDAIMTEWLASDDEVLRRHATIKLGGRRPEAGAPPLALPVASPVWPGCDFREACGCQRPRCWHRANGPRHGTPEPEAMGDGSTRLAYRVTPGQCRACARSGSGKAPGRVPADR